MKRLLLRWVLPLACTVFFLGLAFHWIEEPQRIPGHIAAVPLPIHAGFILITIFSMWLRGVRWRALLPGRGLTARQCFGPLMIGFMLNGLLPARAGEFARSIVLGRRAGLSITLVFGSVVLERVFDGVVLLSSFALVLFLLGAAVPEEAIRFGGFEISGEVIRGAATSSAVLVTAMLAVIVAVLIPPLQRLMAAMLRAALPRRVSDPLIRQIEKLISGFHSLHSPRAIAEVLGWTVAVWATVALSTWVAARGFPELARMNFLQAWAIVVFVCVAILLPASPGYWGLYEIGVIFALKTLGLTDNAGLAFSYSVVMHVWQIATTVGIGLIFLWAQGMGLGQIKVLAAETSPAPEFGDQP